MLTHGMFSYNWAFADVYFYYSFVQLICLFVVLCFSKKKESFPPTQDGSELVQGFLLYVFSSLMKGRLDPDFVFILCFFWKKMVIQKNQKRSFFFFLLFNHFHIICIIIMFISIIKSCINKLVEHYNLVLSLDFEFPVPETEEKEDEEILNEISCLLGHLRRRSCKQNIKKFSQKMTFNYKYWREFLTLALHGIVFQYTLQQGQPPTIPQYAI